jgi:NAD(P)-dependent dehydrogenase (short-subunit alcohol dehydrogenase family)
VIDELTPLERVADWEEFVGAAISLASDAASYVTGDLLTLEGVSATGVTTSGTCPSI